MLLRQKISPQNHRKPLILKAKVKKLFFYEILITVQGLISKKLNKIRLKDHDTMPMMFK